LGNGIEFARGNTGVKTFAIGSLVPCLLKTLATYFTSAGTPGEYFDSGGISALSVSEK